MKTITCDNCNRAVPAVHETADIPDRGLWFSQPDMGYYNGFFDAVGENSVAICHDCSAIFMNAFPGLAAKLLPSRGGHPTVPFNGILSPPCCEWAWTWDEVAPCAECAQVPLYFANADGEWEKKDCQGCVARLSKS